MKRSEELIENNTMIDQKSTSKKKVYTMYTGGKYFSILKIAVDSEKFENFFSYHYLCNVFNGK